ncbi:MAG TPA: polyprenyl diphosphate synthase [Nitrospiria bacterium]|nr:polyprenyl diphosphate synthase [Nitrospiria bacterium]
MSNGNPLHLLYRLYERRLLRELHKDPLPRHIGLILDGNRRYAHGLGFDNPLEGHKMGAQKLEAVLQWLTDLRIRVVTLYALSTENLSRPAHELDGLLALIESKIRSMAADPRVHQQRMRFRAVGQLHLLPESLQEAIATVQQATAEYDGSFLNIAVGYGGRQEITDAVRRLLMERAASRESLAQIAKGLTAEEIGKYLSTYDLPDPDLIIRTSGELRLSGFLLWQSAYSELYFCDTYWPGFRRIDLLRAIRSFQQRQRRFGK